MSSLIPKDATPEQRAKVPRAIITFTLGEQRHQQGDAVMYDLPVPIVVAGWRRLGYEPIVVVVVDSIAQTESAEWTDSPPPTIGMLRKMDVELLSMEKMPPLSAGNTAQIMRLSMPAQKQLWDAELVITSDADSLPMMASYFAQRSPSKRVTVYNADIIKYTQFAMCYVAGSAAAWREFMKLPTTVSTPAEAFKTVHSGSAGWSQDQIVMTARLKAWPGYDQSGNGATQFVELPKTKPFRLDRICCNDDASWDAYFASWQAGKFSAVDFHLFRYTKAEYTRKWKWTKDVLGVIFPPDVVTELDIYIKAAVGA
jgi:hypothetical protein